MASESLHGARGDRRRRDANICAPFRLRSPNRHHSRINALGLGVEIPDTEGWPFLEIRYSRIGTARNKRHRAVPCQNPGYDRSRSMTGGQPGSGIQINSSVMSVAGNLRLEYFGRIEASFYFVAFVIAHYYLKNSGSLPSRIRLRRGAPDEGTIAVLYGEWRSAILSGSVRRLRIGSLSRWGSGVVYRLSDTLPLLRFGYVERSPGDRVELPEFRFDLSDSSRHPIRLSSCRCAHFALSHHSSYGFRSSEYRRTRSF